MGCPRGVLGYYGMSQACSGVVPGCSGFYRHPFSDTFYIYHNNLSQKGGSKLGLS